MPADTAQPRLLIVDDEEAIRTALARYFRTVGYEVNVADSGQAALALLERQRFTAMVCDIRMPEMTGLDLLPRALEADGDLAVLMLTGVNDATTATDALSRGALDYMVKPVELPELRRTIERAAHRRELAIERRRVQQHMRAEVALRSAELERESAALHALTVSVAETLINAIEAKNVFLRGHASRVAELAALTAEELGLPADVVENVRLAGRLHDIGKIGVREEVLKKPGELTKAEYRHVKDHVRIGMEILAPLTHMPVVLGYVHDHHEHFDGSGYPRGLSGEQISIGGRILAAADAFDAITSNRAYRRAIDGRQALAHLGEHEAGRLLDPGVLAALSAVVVRSLASAADQPLF